MSSGVRDELASVLMRAQALPRVEIDVPVNMCPDDDPPGERPTERVWATDIGAVADYVLASPVIDRIRAEAREELIDALETSREQLGDYAGSGELIETARAMSRSVLSNDAGSGS